MIAVGGKQWEWGPFYTLRSTAELLGLPQEEVLRRGNERELLMVTTTDDHMLFPVWQFDIARLDPRIAQILEVFKGLRSSTWLVVQWATTRDPHLDNFSPVEWVTAGYDLEPVLSDARSYAERWSR